MAPDPVPMSAQTPVEYGHAQLPVKRAQQRARAARRQIKSKVK
jgi:hypothetical protein